MILLIGAVRFFLFFNIYQQDPSLIIDPDTLSYLHLSESIYERGAYERVEGIPEAHRPPLYPAYLAVNYTVFGKANLLAPVLLQQLMTLLTALMTAYLAYRLGGRLAAWIAPLLYLTEFTSFYYANEILSETLFAFLLTVSMSMLVIGFQRESISTRWVFGASIVLTAAVFVRPVGLLLIYPATGLLFFVAYWYARDITSALKTGLVFLLPWIVFGGSWYARNYGLSGEIFFTSYEGQALLRRLQPVLMSANQIDLQSANAHISGLIAEGMRPVEVYFNVLFSHPGPFLVETLIDVARVLLSPGQWHIGTYFPATFENALPMETLLLNGEFAQLAEAISTKVVLYTGLISAVLVHLFLVYFGVLASMFFILRKNREKVAIYLFLVLFCVYFIGITAGFIGQPRFRVPFVPFLAVLSAAGFSFLIASRRDPVR